MLDSATPNPPGLANNREIAARTPLLTRKIWLPKPVYTALPYFYILVGILALAATVYISEWFWVVPHYILFSAACLHMGIVIGERRRRARRADD